MNENFEMNDVCNLATLRYDKMIVESFVYFRDECLWKCFSEVCRCLAVLFAQ